MNTNANFSTVFPTDQTYSSGTVLCPDQNGMYTQCSHDNCPKASVVSDPPGLCDGNYKDSDGSRLENVSPLALVGVVSVKTANFILPGVPVVSDGRGAVRPMNHGESGYSMGFTLNNSAVVDGVPQVDILLRPMFVSY